MKLAFRDEDIAFREEVREFVAQRLPEDIRDRCARGYIVGNADEDSPGMVAATKIRVGKAALAVGQGAIQLHGGMGMTNECSIGHYYKRLMMIDILFGTQDYHACRYEQLHTVA